MDKPADPAQNSTLLKPATCAASFRTIGFQLTLHRAFALSWFASLGEDVVAGTHFAIVLVLFRNTMLLQLLASYSENYISTAVHAERHKV